MKCPKCDDWMAREIGLCPEHQPSVASVLPLLALLW